MFSLTGKYVLDQYKYSSPDPMIPNSIGPYHYDVIGQYSTDFVDSIAVYMPDYRTAPNRIYSTIGGMEKG